jgi:hypothetical protein
VWSLLPPLLDAPWRWCEQLFASVVRCVTNNCCFPCPAPVVLAVYQMKFATITPAIVAGSFAERVNFSGYLLFIVLFSLFVYVAGALTPILHSPSGALTPILHSPASVCCAARYPWRCLHRMAWVAPPYDDTQGGLSTQHRTALLEGWGGGWGDGHMLSHRRSLVHEDWGELSMNLCCACVV